MNIVPFILYGLVGCPTCAQAEEYLRKVGVPFAVFVVNGDPIADEGIKKITGKEVAEYPVLLYKATKELVVGYKPEDYERLAKSFYTLVGTSTPSVFDSQQQPVA
jgi:glutaredoxin